MGDFSENVLKRKDYDPPRGEVLCEALRSHHPGLLEGYRAGKDGALGWRPYRGCMRCGIALVMFLMLTGCKAQRLWDCVDAQGRILQSRIVDDTQNSCSGNLVCSDNCE